MPPTPTILPSRAEIATFFETPESVDVLVVEDCCAAATTELHEAELRILNMICCHVVALDDVAGLLA